MCLHCNLLRHFLHTVIPSVMVNPLGLTMFSQCVFWMHDWTHNTPIEWPLEIWLLWASYVFIRHILIPFGWQIKCNPYVTIMGSLVTLWTHWKPHVWCFPWVLQMFLPTTFETNYKFNRYGVSGQVEVTLWFHCQWNPCMRSGCAQYCATWLHYEWC